MIRLPNTVPIPAPDPATPTVAAPAPMNLAAVSMSRLTALVWKLLRATWVRANWGRTEALTYKRKRGLTWPLHDPSVRPATYCSITAIARELKHDVYFNDKQSLFWPGLNTKLTRSRELIIIISNTLERQSHKNLNWHHIILLIFETFFKGVVDCLFSMLDCVYGMQSNGVMLHFFYITLFYIALSLLSWTLQ